VRVSRPNVRKRVFCEIPLGFGMLSQMKKPGAIEQQTLHNRAPGFLGMFREFARRVRAAERAEDVEAVEARVEPKEIRAVAAFMRDHTVGLVGYVEEDGSAVAWGDLDGAERLDFWNGLGAMGLVHAYGFYLGATTTASNPHVGRGPDGPGEEE